MVFKPDSYHLYQNCMQKPINKKKQKPVEKKKPDTKPVPPLPEERQEVEEGYGGIPDRDMKKNLGCG